MKRRTPLQATRAQKERVFKMAMRWARSSRTYDDDNALVRACAAARNDKRARRG